MILAPHLREGPGRLGPWITRRQAFPIRDDRWDTDVELLCKRLRFKPAATSRDDRAAEDASQARRVSASVEWKRMPAPDATPRRWVAYVDNASDAPITVDEVVVRSDASLLTIADWGKVRPSEASDYEIEEADFDPRGDRPQVTVRFVDSFGQKWTLGKRLRRRDG